MKKFLLGGVALVALAVGDRAMADGPAARPWNWTGFYLGGDIGAQWTHAVWTAISLRDLPGVQQPGWSSLGIDASSPSEFDLSGARIGSHVGYNYQFAPRWVGGIEVDFGYAKRTENAIGFPGCTITCNAFLGTPLSEPAAGGDVTSVDVRWDASVRARLGYLATPEVLVYATGGLAWQSIEATGLCGDWHTSNYCFGPGPGLGQPVPSFVTQATTRTGLTVGGGIEWRIFGNWLVRGEYRYANFGTWNSAFPFGPSVNPFTGESGDDNTYRFRLSTETHVATFGLTYKID
jgi:outer membrane immunogenic protein